MKQKEPQLFDPSALPSYFSAWRFACGCFGIEMPQMERMLKIIRKREQEPDKYFPKRLSRTMLNDADRGIGMWANADHAPLVTIAREALYDQIRRKKNGKPLFGFTGDLTERLVFALLRLYKLIVPRLNNVGVSTRDCIWLLIEEVFVPTVFIELRRNWQRGLGSEFQFEACWYLPRVKKSKRLNPVQQVLHCWFRAAGFRYAYDLGKALDDESLRRKVDRWLNGTNIPEIREAHSLVGKFANDVRWLDSPDDWKARLTLACSTEQACRQMDEYFQHLKPNSSSNLAKMLKKIAKENVMMDDGLELAEPETFFAARLLQRRLQNEGRWEKEVMSLVSIGGSKTFLGGVSNEEIERYQNDLNWRMTPGNWFLEFIKRDPDLPKAAQEGKSLSEAILDLGIRELNLILGAKRGRRAFARRP